MGKDRSQMKNLFKIFLIIGIVVGTLASASLVMDLVQKYNKKYFDVDGNYTA